MQKQANPKARKGTPPDRNPAKVSKAQSTSSARLALLALERRVSKLERLTRHYLGEIKEGGGK